MAVNRHGQSRGGARSGIKRSALAVFALAAALFRLGSARAVSIPRCFRRAIRMTAAAAAMGSLADIRLWGLAPRVRSQLILAHYGAGRRRPVKRKVMLRRGGVVIAAR